MPSPAVAAATAASYELQLLGSAELANRCGSSQRKGGFVHFPLRQVSRQITHCERARSGASAGGGLVKSPRSMVGLNVWPQCWSMCAHKTRARERSSCAAALAIAQYGIS